jgi:hypothetical protein
MAILVVVGVILVERVASHESPLTELTETTVTHLATDTTASGTVGVLAPNQLPSSNPADSVGSIRLRATNHQSTYPTTVAVTRADEVRGFVVVVMSITNDSPKMLSYILFNRSPTTGDSEKYFLLDSSGSQYHLSGIDQPHESMNVPFLPWGDSMSVLEIALGAHRQLRISFACTAPVPPLRLLHTTEEFSSHEIFVSGESVRLPEFQINDISLARK